MLRLAEELGHPPSMAVVLIFLARLHQYLGDPERTRDLADATMSLASEQGFAQRLARRGGRASGRRPPIAGSEAPLRREQQAKSLCGCQL